MKEPIISPDFTIEDIHKIREYNYEMTKDMTFEERKKYYEADLNEFNRLIEERRKNKISS